jgi:hypothetical protein
MKMKKLPRYILDQISTRMTTLELFDDVPPAEAKKRAIAEVAERTGYKPSALRSPTPPKNARRSSGLYSYQDFLDVYNSLMADPVTKHFKSPSTPSPVTGGSTVRRTRQPKPSPPEEPPAPPRRDLLYAVGLSGNIGVRSGAININHEFSDSPATQTWRQQNGRV